MAASPLHTLPDQDMSQTREGSMTPLAIGGELTNKDLRKFAEKARSGNIGPTSVYYAGVTAPAIAAGMASLVSSSLERAAWSDYWVLMTSSLIAAMSGITWYLIFMRWSYRHSFGRATESSVRTDLEADELGIFWTRGAVKSRITWDGIVSVERTGKFIRIRVRDSEDLVIPSRWFADKNARNDLFERLQACLSTYGSKNSASDPFRK